MGSRQSDGEDIVTTNWSGTFIDTKVQLPATQNARIFDLAVALEPGMPRHPFHPPYAYALAKKHGDGMYGNGVSSAMEVVSMGAHVGTHVDARGHVAKNGKVYGDREVFDAQSPSSGLRVASIEETPPIIGPGHLVDMVKLLGRYPEPKDGLGPEEFEKWFADKAPPSPGSVVLVRTGWMRFWPHQDDYIGLATGLPGVTIDGAKWLSERGIIATGSDTMNYEHKPSSAIINLPVHVHNLVENGISIMESLNLEVLAEHEFTDFTFVAIPLRIKGGTGSPIRPIAIVARDTQEEK